MLAAFNQIERLDLIKKIIKQTNVMVLLFLPAVIFAQTKKSGVSNKPDIAIYLDSTKNLSERVTDLLSRMTLEEKISQMCQYVGIEHQIESYKINKGKDPASNDDASSFYKGISFDSLRNMISNGQIGSFLHVVTAKEANELQRLALKSKLKIPLLIGIDAIHGNALVSGCTVYPSPLGLASTFNPELVESLSSATAKEMRATGSHWSFTPNIDIARDARWGRVGETFGEDPLLVSKMGVATVKGLQGEKMAGDQVVLSCIKHLIGGGNSVNGLNGSPTDISERTLWEVHLPPYQAAIDAGAYSVMTAHNELNGVPCHANRYLMEKVLREKMGFKGFFVSDWMDIERLYTIHHVATNPKDAVYQAVKAGMDMHMHGPGFFESLVQLVKEGRLTVGEIDRSARLILEAKFRLGLFENPFVNEKKAAGAINTKDNQQLSLLAARQSIVLLKNQELLPLKNKYKKILVTGPNANDQTILGDWSLPQPDENVVTILEGLQSEAPNGTVISYSPTGTVKKIDETAIETAANAASNNDIIIVAVGENSLRYQTQEKTSGENIDRDDIELIGQQKKLIQRLVNSGKPVIVVLVNSRPLAVTAIAEQVPALIEAWEPGNKGGQALAEIIFGKINPSGKLPISIPRSTGQIPTYYNYKPSNFFHKYIETQSGALYDFGFGLSYSTFKFDNLNLSNSKIKKSDSVIVNCTVANVGNEDGEEVVQLYIRDEVSLVTRPVKELKAFKRIAVKSKSTEMVSLVLHPEDFQFLDIDMNKVIESGEYTIMVGNSSNDNNLIRTKLIIE